MKERVLFHKKTFSYLKYIIKNNSLVSANRALLAKLSQKSWRRNRRIFTILTRLASVGILGKEREPGVGKLGWHGNFDTGFERNVFRSKSRVWVF